MFGKLWSAVDGYKTYVLGVLGILIALTGHFWGPYGVGGFTVPQFSWDEVWKVLWSGGLFAALRHGQNP